MPRKATWGSAKTPPSRQRQRKQTTQLGELDTTPTRPDASPSFPAQKTIQNSGSRHSVEYVDSEGFEDGIEDVDLAQLADTQPVSPTTVHKGFSWSETGSGARRSSSVSSAGSSKGPFGYLGLGNAFSSPASGSDALPDTVPLPLELMHDPLLGDQRQPRVIVDFSETATTVLRSSPMTGSRLSKSLGTSSHRDFVDKVWIDDGLVQPPSQPVLLKNNKPSSLQTEKPVQVATETSSGTLVSVDPVKATDIDLHGVRSVSKTNYPHRNTDVNLTTHFVSLDGAADGLGCDDEAGSETFHVADDGKKQKRKRKQRPKTPLQFDDDTQEVKDVFKRPARKRKRRQPAQKDVKAAPSPLKSVLQQEEIAQPSPNLASAKGAECLPATRCHSPPVAMEANMDGVAPEMLGQRPVEDTDCRMTEAPADMSPHHPQEEGAVDVSGPVEAEIHAASPTSSDINSQMSENNSPRTPPTITTEIQDDDAKTHAPVIEDTSTRENLTVSLQTSNEKDDEYATQKKQSTGETHAPARRHNVKSSSQLAHVDVLRSIHDQIGKTSSASKAAGVGKLNPAAARPARHISVSGQGSPMRLSPCENNPVNPTWAEESAPEIWSGTGHTGCPTRPVLNATQDESGRSHNNTKQAFKLAVAHKTHPPTTVSPFGVDDDHGLRQSILSELKKKHVNRRIVSGQNNKQVTEPADKGRQRLHELVDACMQHLDSKKKYMIEIADTYAKAGNHCVGKIQSRFEKERFAVTRLATKDTADFFKAISDGKESVERNSAKKGRSMKQFKQLVFMRAAAYAQASSALDTLHDAVLTEDNACSTLGS